MIGGRRDVGGRNWRKHGRFILENINSVLRPEIPEEAKIAATLAAILSGPFNEPHESLVSSAYKLLDIAIKASETRQEARLVAEAKHRKGY